MDSRSSSLGFAERTRKNLMYIERGFAAGADVHVITQLVNSLLGLVVFPWERHFLDQLRKRPLADLAKAGWPEWQIMQGKCVTLWELIRYLRNGTSHGHLQFSSDDRLLQSVFIEVSNYPKQTAPHPDFVARIRADLLRDFVLRFSQLVEDVID